MLQSSPATKTAARAEGGAPAVTRSAVLPMIEVSIQRLEEIVDQETFALRTRKAVNLKEFNDRKSQALLELTRSLRQMQGTEKDPALAARVGSLKAKLAINQAALKVHLEAVREVANTLADVIRHADSDGTYTQSSAAKRS